MKSAPSVESLFQTLKAENEPWLDGVIVTLPIFERLSENNSTILYGEPGSGKTAARLELTKHQKKLFVVLWTPEPLEEPAIGTELAHQAVQQVLGVCLDALVVNGRLPAQLKEPSGHITSALQWFLQKYSPFGDPTFFIQSQADHLSQDDVQWYLKLLERSAVSPIGARQINLKEQIRLLITILRQADYSGLLLAIDGLERWAPLRAGKQIEKLMDAILSTLMIFDIPGVTYKFFMPASLKSILQKTTGVERHRAIEVSLTWSFEELQTLLEKRITYALSTRKGSLNSLCEGNEFLAWLKEFGGVSPREWLRLTMPLISEHQQRGKRLTLAQTREFIRRHPAPLRLHTERREVWLGQKCISIGSATEFRVLEYLAERPGKIGSLEELYYYAQAELDTVPDMAEPKWVAKKAWRGAMDNVILRLRKKIEPDPKEPVYLVTHHGRGIELLHIGM